MNILALGSLHKLEHLSLRALACKASAHAQRALYASEVFQIKYTNFHSEQYQFASGAVGLIARRGGEKKISLHGG
jgi:hypothetical protein